MNRGTEVLLQDTLKELKLPAMRRDFTECARQARQSGDSYEDYLLALASRELEQRQANQLARRIKEARFPLLKTLEQTDLKKWPSFSALQIREYAQARYVADKDNLILLGKHGTGKTHAVTVLGVEACRRGHRVLFTTAADLVNTLVEAREEKRLKRFLARLHRFPLVIVDELGYLPFSAEGAQLLFQVFSERYERGSLMVTSNLPFAQWTSIFGDATLTAALLDRLTHHCFIHEFDWESLRLTESLKRRKQLNSKAKNRAVAATAPPAGTNEDEDQEGAPS